MDEFIAKNSQYFSIFIGFFTVMVCYWFYRKYSQEPDQPDDEVSEENHEIQEEQQQVNKKVKKVVVAKKKEVKDNYSHSWLLTNLKGHNGNVLDMDFSSNGKQLASCSNDRAVMLWSVKTFADKNHRSVRANIEFDFASHIRWSPDSKAFIVSTSSGNAVQVYKVGKKSDGQPGNVELILTFPSQQKAEIINVGIACNGHFIMSCSSDTTIIVWDLKGQTLASIDTLHINNYHACISPCGRFIASSGFTPDVRIWEVCFTKSGEFKEVKRAFELKGHTSGVYHFSFSSDSSRMLTYSKDGTWKLWDTNIEYSKGQEPYLLHTVNHADNSRCITSLSPDGRTVAIASCSKSELFLYSGVNGSLQTKLKDIHTDPITSVLFTPDGQYLLVAAGKLIRIFHNVPGYHNRILDMEESKKSAKNISMKERLQSQIDELKSILDTFERS